MKKEIVKVELSPEAEAQLEADKPKRSYSPAQKAGMLCKEPEFQKWIITELLRLYPATAQPIPHSEDEAAKAIYYIFGISSRKALNSLEDDWTTFIAPYLTQTGQVAEDRS